MLYMSRPSELPTAKDCRNILKFLDWWSRGCFIPFFGAKVQWHCHSPHWTTACHSGNRKCPPHQEWCHPHSLWVIGLPSNENYCDTCASNIIWIGHQLTSDATAPLMWTHNLHCELSMELLPQHNGTCQISWGPQGQRLRPRTWSSSCFHGALYFPCQPSMPWAWGYTPSGCPRWAPGHQQRLAPMAHLCRTRGSSTRIKNSGLRIKPWSTPTLRSHSSLYWPPTPTWFRVSPYMP